MKIGIITANPPALHRQFMEAAPPDMETSVVADSASDEEKISTKTKSEAPSTSVVNRLTYPAGSTAWNKRADRLTRRTTVSYSSSSRHILTGHLMRTGRSRTGASATNSARASCACMSSPSAWETIWLRKISTDSTKCRKGP